MTVIRDTDLYNLNKYQKYDIIYYRFCFNCFICEDE